MRPGPGTLLAHVLAWAYAAILVLPMLYLLLSSVKTNLQIFTDPYGLPPGPPADWGWVNYEEAWEIARLDAALLSSVYVTVGSVLVTLFLAIPAAYALARTQGRWRDVIQSTFTTGFLIPPFAALIPTVFVAIELGLFQQNEFLVAFLPAGAMPLSVILLTAFMRTIPAELAESAAMDGAGHLRVLTRIYIPLAMPGIITVVILQALGFWNEFFYSLVIVGTNPTERTIQVALPTALINDNTEFGVLAAGTVISLLPVYLVYVVLQRRMQEALTAGAVKG